MSTDEQYRHVRVVCEECPFSKVVEKVGDTPAEVISEHGRETGHKLTTEPVEQRE